MTLQESRFRENAPQTYSFTAALLNGEALRISEDLIFQPGKRTRFSNRGSRTIDRVIYTTKPASQEVFIRKSEGGPFPQLRTKPERTYGELEIKPIRIIQKYPFWQIGQSYRLNVFEAETPEGAVVVLKITSLIPMRPTIFNVKTGQVK